MTWDEILRRLTGRARPAISQEIPARVGATDRSPVASEAPRAGLGETIAEAQSGAFFVWFSLEAVDDAKVFDEKGPPAEAFEWHRFRPSGRRFHDLVELAIHLDGDERITQARLGIDRRFIVDAAIRPFARDIAKSFLQWILPAQARATLEPEIDAISQFCDGESVVIVRSSAIRSAPWLKWRSQRGRDEMPAVFMGSAARAERRIGQTRIVFENVVDGLPRARASQSAIRHATPDKEQDDWLLITVEQPLRGT